MFKKKSTVADARDPGPVGRLRRFVLHVSCWLVLSGFAGCRTIPPLPVVNLAEPGWKIQQGQAVWRANKEAPEIAGEVLVATHPDGRAFVQFTKTPFPFVTAQLTDRAWQIEFAPQNKSFSGPGRPPGRLVWLQLPRALTGGVPVAPWSWQLRDQTEWRLENKSTGEFLEGSLAQ